MFFNLELSASFYYPTLKITLEAPNCIHMEKINTVAAKLQNYCQIGKRIFISGITFKFYKINFLYLKLWKDCTNPKISFSNWKEVSKTIKQFSDESVHITVCGIFTQKKVLSIMEEVLKVLVYLFCKLQVTLVLRAMFCHRCGREFNNRVLFCTQYETEKVAMKHITFCKR